MAQRFGLDTEQFGQCIEEETHLDRIYDQHRDAFANGITSTPTVLVDGERAPVVADPLIERVKQATDGA